MSTQIYNRIIKPDGTIKHVENQDLLNHLDVIEKSHIRDRISVLTPKGDKATIEMWELKNALNTG